MPPLSFSSRKNRRSPRWGGLLGVSPQRRPRLRGPTRLTEALLADIWEYVLGKEYRFRTQRDVAYRSPHVRPSPGGGRSACLTIGIPAEHHDQGPLGSLLFGNRGPHKCLS